MEKAEHLKGGSKDADLIHLSKELYDSDELRAIVKHDTHAIRDWLRRHALGTSKLLKGGMYLMANTMIPSIEAHLDETFRDRDRLVRDFLRAYRDDGENGIIARAQKRLGRYFKRTDYPDARAVADMFGAAYSYVTLDTPSNLAAVSEELYQRELDKAEARIHEAEQEIVAALRQEVFEFADAWASRLDEKEDGKRRVIRQSAVDRLTEFLDTYSFRQIMDDPQLSKEVENLRKVMKSFDLEEVKKNEKTRDALRKRFETIRDSAKQLVTEAPIRRIELD